MQPTAESQKPRVTVHLIWACVVLAVAAVPMFLGWTARDSAEGVRDDIAATLRAAFQGDVTHRFYSSGPQLREGRGLEVASLRMAESFERTHIARFLGIEGVSHVRVDVPVTYRYFVPWDNGWRVVLTRGAPDTLSGLLAPPICVVEAPALEPFLPPAIHTHEMRIDRAKEWHLQRFNQAIVDSVLTEITPVTTERAQSLEYRTLVREAARKRLKEFVRLWVLQMDEIDPETDVRVYVRFADDEQIVSGQGDGFFREFEIQ